MAKPKRKGPATFGRASDKLVLLGSVNKGETSKIESENQEISTYHVDRNLLVTGLAAKTLGQSEIKFVVPGIPTAWARTSSNGRVRFTPQKQRIAGGVIQIIAADAMAGRAPLEGPVSMSVIAVWPWPKAMTERKRGVAGSHFRTSRPDADNVAKLVADALIGICYLDDAQIVELRVLKQFGRSAATFVRIAALVVPA